VRPQPSQQVKCTCLIRKGGRASAKPLDGSLVALGGEQRKSFQILKSLGKQGNLLLEGSARLLLCFKGAAKAVEDLIRLACPLSDQILSSLGILDLLLETN
jgi:hypothetical protein